MHTQVNRFKHLPRWFWEIENKEKFRGSSYWHNTAAQQARRAPCAQTLHNSGISLRSLNDAVMKDIGFDHGAVGVLYLDERIHRTPADEERYKSQLNYLNQFQRTSLTSNSLFSIIKIDNVSAGNDAFQAVTSSSVRAR